MSPALLLTCYCLLILLASLAGGWIPLFIKLTHLRLQLATSFVAGLMLGVGLLHMLPHAVREMNSIEQASLWLLVGFLLMFIIQRFLHFHHHDVPEESSAETAGRCEHEHAAAGGFLPSGDLSHTLAHQSASQLSWGGAAMGLSLHTLINGVALAASVEAAAHLGHPIGDFALECGLVAEDGPQRLTFSGIGLYRPELFRGVAPGSRAPLAPLLREAMRGRLVSGQHFTGCWVDVGTPERLAELDAKLRTHALSA